MEHGWEDGTRLYVSCLTYFEDLPSALACQHSALLGACASRALCLVSHQPYLASMERMLLRLHAAIFITGPLAPVGDLLALLMRIPCPQLGTQPVPLTTMTAAGPTAASTAPAAGGMAAAGLHGPTADGAPSGDLHVQGMGEGG
ncbi:hypothetical protein DUNSADRAFT_16255 [Dunaliella salina]|uniref:Uncharacterized protein n=1 Tax=Dunaliella salina TaxID=3046 RepID=A0ABQ7H160_DUNSA|nr:hypothetical protein DUNSADRAFT_16255 [Dunaliella salina]|eukprot:KAF5840592.1 hypothetical protein DUNSADRAFT_16255 [Dunaliella salina]